MITLYQNLVNAVCLRITKPIELISITPLSYSIDIESKITNEIVNINLTDESLFPNSYKLFFMYVTTDVNSTYPDHLLLSTGQYNYTVYINNIIVEKGRLIVLESTIIADNDIIDKYDINNELTTNNINDDNIDVPFVIGENNIYPNIINNPKSYPDERYE